MKTLTQMLLFSLALLSVPASAEIEKFGNVDVNYNVITTDTLSPQVAKAYGIKRSKHRLMLTVAVSSPNEKGLPTPIPAKVSANYVNMMAQQRVLRMRSIKEDEALYYIGDFAFSVPDTLRFTLNVTESGAEKPRKIEFQRSFEKY